LTLKKYSYLTPDGVIVAETANDEELSNDTIYPFEVRKSREYGDTKVWYLQRIDDEEGEI